VQTICTSLHADNHTNTSSANFTGQMLFLTPNQQSQSTKGDLLANKNTFNKKTASLSQQASSNYTQMTQKHHAFGPT